MTGPLMPEDDVQMPFIRYNYDPLPDSLVNRVITKLPYDVRKLLMAYKHSVCVAGGFIRAVLQGEDPKDVDLFLSNDTNVKSAETLLGKDRPLVLRTRNAITLGKVSERAVNDWPVQIVTRWTDSPPNAIERFDFTICQAAIWWQEDQLTSLACERFEQDALDRKMVYTGPERAEDPLSSLERLMRFRTQGYTVSGYQFAKVIMRALQRVQEQGGLDVPFSQWHQWALRSGLGGGY